MKKKFNISTLFCSSKSSSSPIVQPKEKTRLKDSPLIKEYFNSPPLFEKSSNVSQKPLLNDLSSSIPKNQIDVSKTLNVLLLSSQRRQFSTLPNKSNQIDEQNQGDLFFEALKGIFFDFYFSS